MSSSGRSMSLYRDYADERSSNGGGRTCPRGKQKPKPPANYKTELCRNFQKDACCDYREKCLFVHGASELRAPPGAEPPTAPNTPPRPAPQRATGGSSSPPSQQRSPASSWAGDADPPAAGSALVPEHYLGTFVFALKTSDVPRMRAYASGLRLANADALFHCLEVAVVQQVSPENLTVILEARPSLRDNPGQWIDRLGGIILKESGADNCFCSRTCWCLAVLRPWDPALERDAGFSHASKPAAPCGSCFSEHLICRTVSPPRTLFQSAAQCTASTHCLRRPYQWPVITDQPQNCSLYICLRICQPAKLASGQAMRQLRHANNQQHCRNGTHAVPNAAQPSGG